MNSKNAINIEPIIPIMYIPVPVDKPTAIPQNKKPISLGSFIAERKRIIESAPTIPNDKAKLLPIIIITIDVTVEINIIVMLKFFEYITPE